MPQPLPVDACREGSWRWPAARAASATMSEGAGRSAEPSGPSARGAGECPGRSAGPQATPGFERGQAAPPWGREETFVSRLHSARSRPQNGQECIGPHREGHMAVPACQLRTSSWSRPTSPVAASQLLSMVHRVPATRPTAAKVVSWGAKTPDAVSSVGVLIRRRTSSQRRQGLGHGQPVPVIPPWTFRAIARTQPRPAGLRLGGQDRVDLTLSPAPPDGLRAGDGQDIRLGMGCHPQAQASVMPIHAIPRDPSGGHTGGAGARQPLASQWRCGGTGAVLRDPGRLAAVSVVGPLVGPIALTIQQGMAQRTGIAQPHADLAVLHLARRAPVWVAPPAAWRPCFKQPVSSLPSTASGSPAAGSPSGAVHRAPPRGPRGHVSTGAGTPTAWLRH